MTESGISQQITDLKMQEMEQGSSSATENQQAYDESIAKLDKLLAEGHKLMLAQSFYDASVVLSEAAESASKFFGDFAPQSFLPHLTYGKALTEMARLNSLPIKPPLENIESDDEDEQTEELQNKNETDTGDNIGEGKEGNLTEGGKEKSEENDTDEKKEITKEKGGEKGTEQAADEKNEQSKKSEVEQTDNEKDIVLEGVEAEEDGDEEDSQIAWENLEVARKICENQMKGDQMNLWMERKSDVLVALGDCMTVSENFPCALEEFSKALDIRKELFGDVDRRVAEVHFWIGRTHKLMNDFKTAAEHFENAKKVLETVITAKDKLLNEEGEESRAILTQELEELKEAVKELDETIQDAVDSTEQQRKREEAMKEVLKPLIMQAFSATEKTAEANDITGMVKRKATKRPLEVAGANDNNSIETDVQQSAKMPKMEADNKYDGNQQTTGNGSGENGN